MDKVLGQHGRFELRVRTHSGGGLYELEESTTWTLVDTERDLVVGQWKGLYEASYDGAGWGDATVSGVREVTLGPDGVRITHTDGTEQVEPLPG